MEFRCPVCGRLNCKEIPQTGPGLTIEREKVFMADRELVCLNADRTKIVSCDSEEAAFQIEKGEADKLFADQKAAAAAENKARKAAEDK